MPYLYLIFITVSNLGKCIYRRLKSESVNESSFTILLVLDVWIRTDENYIQISICIYFLTESQIMETTLTLFQNRLSRSSRF